MVLKNSICFSKLLIILLVNTLCKGKYNQLKNSLALEMLLSNQKNVVISPFMIRFPLCKLASVAQGTAKSDLLSILGMKPNEVQKCYTGFEKIVEGLKLMDFLTLNKIIVNYTDDVNPQFISNSTNYGVRVDKVGFNYPNLAVSFINRWVDKAMYKRVTDLLKPGDINNKTSMLIINAAYLKMTWEIPFDIRSTKDKKFHHHSGRVSVVPMMIKKEECLYLNDELSHTKYVTMKLASFGITMTVMIPETIKGLPQLLRKLLNEPDYVSGVRKRMRFEIVQLSLPRFKIKSALELNELIQKIGGSIIFNDTNSGLNAILNKKSKVQNIYVSKVKQKNFIDVDETGIFRQLPSAIDDGMPGRVSVANEIVFDHPFYFTVDIQTDILNTDHIYNMFQGVYYGPED